MLKGLSGRRSLPGGLGKALQSALMPHEVVRIALEGRLGHGIALTDLRVIFVRAGRSGTGEMFGQQAAGFWLRDVTGVQFATGLLEGRLQVIVRGVPEAQTVCPFPTTGQSRASFVALYQAIQQAQGQVQLGASADPPAPAVSERVLAPPHAPEAVAQPSAVVHWSSAAPGRGSGSTRRSPVGPSAAPSPTVGAIGCLALLGLAIILGVGWWGRQDRSGPPEAPTQPTASTASPPGTAGATAPTVTAAPNTSPASATTPTTSSASTTEASARDRTTSFTPSYQVTRDGYQYDGVMVSNVGIVVVGAERTSVLGKNPYARERAGSGTEFLVLTIYVRNQQNDQIVMDAGLFKVMVGSKEFSHSGEGDLALRTDGIETFSFKAINPGVGVLGKVAFQVPEGLPYEEARLSVRGGLTGRTAVMPLLPDGRER